MRTKASSAQATISNLQRMMDRTVAGRVPQWVDELPENCVLLVGTSSDQEDFRRILSRAERKDVMVYCARTRKDADAVLIRCTRPAVAASGATAEARCAVADYERARVRTSRTDS